MKMLAIVRDLVIIVGVTIMCGILVTSALAKERQREARLQQTLDAIKELDATYKAAVFDSTENKGIYQQIFRQNEIAIEYEKLHLLRDLLPTTRVSRNNAPPLPK
jgi:hypothetical protein